LPTSCAGIFSGISAAPPLREHGTVAGAVLRIVGGGVENDGALLLHPPMGAIDVGAVGGMERYMMQPGAVAIVRTRRPRRPQRDAAEKPAVPDQVPDMQRGLLHELEL
jgi:hypothetical protein